MLRASSRRRARVFASTASSSKKSAAWAIGASERGVAASAVARACGCASARAWSSEARRSSEIESAWARAGRARGFAASSSDASAASAAVAGNVYDLDEHFMGTLLPEAASVRALNDAFEYSNRMLNTQEGKKKSSPVRRLLARESDEALRAAIDSHRRVDVRGSRGSGKSVALARLVMRAREAGWVVAYLPDCLELTRFSFFSKSTKEGCEGLWDTPDCAMRVLKHVANASNEEVLRSVKVQGVTLPQEQSQKGKGKKAQASKASAADVDLFEYAKAGASNPDIAIDCAITVLGELRELAKRGEHKVVFIADQYNTMFGPSDMHEVTGPRSRKNIPVENLRLARAVIETIESSADEDAKHVSVTAACDSVGISNANTQRSRPDESDSSVGTVTIPKFSTDEIDVILREYKRMGIVKSVVDAQAVAAMKALTNGNPREIQALAATWTLS